MSSPDSETRALQRLSRITWRDHGDGFIAMQGYFTPNGARELLQDLGEEAQQALGLVFIAAHTKAVMRKDLAEGIFRLEGLPLTVQEKARALSQGEELFALQMKAHGLYPVREHQFHPHRKWRFDFAFPDAKVRPIGIEIEGGSQSLGRHNRAQGFEADAEKYNAAQMLGWMVLRYTTAMVKLGIAERQVAGLMWAL